LEQAIAAAPPGEHRDWLRLQLLERQLDAHPPANADSLVAAFQLPDAGPVLNERLGDLLQKFPAAAAAAARAYELAWNQSMEPVDRIRIGLKLAHADLAANEPGRARAVLDVLRHSLPTDASRFGITPQLVSGIRRGPGARQELPFDADAP
jgi:hypothetical protein